MTSGRQQSQPILIVRGGIGGFAAALALNKAGIKVHLFERASEIKEIGAGFRSDPIPFMFSSDLASPRRFAPKQRCLNGWS